jgi:hypothetical protein
MSLLAVLHRPVQHGLDAVWYQGIAAYMPWVGKDVYCRKLLKVFNVHDA